MIVSVIGLGYIGLPTAAILASRGVSVIGVDVNQSAVDIINQGKIHIIEPELDILVQEVVEKNQNIVKEIFNTYKIEKKSDIKISKIGKTKNLTY